VSVLSALVLGLMAYAVFVLVAMRSRSSGGLRIVRLVNRAVFNPLQMRSAGGPGASASVVRHRGRRSGRTYETPVDAVATDDGFVIALPYGAEADWVKNVLSAGSAVIVDEGTAHTVGEPSIEPITEHTESFPTGQQRTLRCFGVSTCLRLHASPTG
jgi:deazaflavin-dependent oxidoreductase (nitroreductase family)